MQTAEASALIVGNLVRLREPVAHVRGVPAGMVGQELVTGLPYKRCTVTVRHAGLAARDEQVYAIRVRHRERVGDAPLDEDESSAAVLHPTVGRGPARTNGTRWRRRAEGGPFGAYHYGEVME